MYPNIQEVFKMLFNFYTFIFIKDFLFLEIKSDYNLNLLRKTYLATRKFHQKVNLSNNKFSGGSMSF